jgi:protein required for attachment to host cells
MSVTWIVVADSSRTRILTPHEKDPRPLDENVHFVGRAGYAGPEKYPAEHLDEVESLVHPVGQMKRGELESDRPGRVKAPGVAESYEAKHKDFNHQVAEDFVREIVEYLTHARQEHRFEKLILVAPPLFLGVMRKHLPKALKQLVTCEIDKDYTKLTSDEIRSHLPEEL